MLIYRAWIEWQLLGRRLERSPRGVLRNLPAFYALLSPGWFCSIRGWVILRVWVNGWVYHRLDLKSGRKWFFLVLGQVGMFTLKIRITRIFVHLFPSVLFLRSHTVSQWYTDTFLINNITFSPPYTYYSYSLTFAACYFATILTAIPTCVWYRVTVTVLLLLPRVCYFLTVVCLR